jgi:hypothetical protein
MGYLAYAIGFTQMIAGWLQTRRLDAWMRGIDHCDCWCSSVRISA